MLFVTGMASVIGIAIFLIMDKKITVIRILHACTQTLSNKPIPN